MIDIDEDDLCYWQNKQTGGVFTGKAKLNKSFLDQNVWICDVEKLNNLLKTNHNLMFIIGMPDNIDEIIDLVDKIILFQCQPETFLNRIKKREDNEFGKDITAQKEIMSWKDDFENRMLSKGTIVIDTEQSVDSVLNQVLEVVK